MSLSSILPSFRPENRKLYAWANNRVQTAHEFADSAPTPEDAAAIRRYADRLQHGMRVKKACDAVETTGLVLMQVGACGLPAMFFGATAVMMVGGSFFGGMLLYVGSILHGGGAKEPTRAVLKGVSDALTYARYEQELEALKRLQAEAAKQVQTKVAQFGTVLQKVAAQPPSQPEEIKREGDVLKIGNLSVPVRTPTLQDALPPPR